MCEPITASMIVGYAVGVALTKMMSAGMRAGSDWAVDEASVAAVEKIYNLTHDAEGNKIDHRRKPWCTMRRFCAAYKTGDKDKFKELRESIRELKEHLTAEERKNLAAAIGEGGGQAVTYLCDALDVFPM
jgi:hypothetical protein